MKPVHLNDSSTRLTNVFESFSAKSAKFSTALPSAMALLAPGNGL